MRALSACRPAAVAGAACVLAAAALGAASASAAPPTTPSASSPAPATTAPVAGHARLTLLHVHGHPPIGFTGRRVAVLGRVTPYVAGQWVTVTFFRDGRRVGRRTVAVAPAGGGAGRFSASYAGGGPGGLWATATHAATAGQSAFRARTRTVRVVKPDLHVGDSGSSVYELQRLMWRLHVVTPVTGHFDDATARGVIAYRKLLGLARDTVVDSHLFVSLARGAGSFHVRYRGDGKHVEGDLSRQVLALIGHRGQVEHIYTMSSGKPSTPTVVGRFRVYRKDLGTNSEGMVDSNYFISGYAVHGYADVPTYPASHGCLRVPIPDAAAIYGWISLGDRVDVYYESGGGSHHVRGNAGP